MLKSAASIRRWDLIHILNKLVLSLMFNLFKLMPVNLTYVSLQSKRPVAMCRLVKQTKKHLLEKFQIHKCPTPQY